MEQQEIAEKKEMPEWVKKFRQKGTQISFIRGNYYLYKIKTIWDKEKKKPKKINEGYLGKITPEGVIPAKHRRKNDDLRELRKDDKILQQLQIIRDISSGKNKDDVAKSFDISTKTIDNIKTRFEEEGVKGLIHTRSSTVEIVKVSTPEQAAIIMDIVQHPDKTAKEIKTETLSKLSVSDIKKIILPIKMHMEVKKKILLEIE